MIKNWPVANPWKNAFSNLYKFWKINIFGCAFYGPPGINELPSVLSEDTEKSETQSSKRVAG